MRTRLFFSPRMEPNMSPQHQFYLDRAAEARAGASAAMLDNVRERWLRSEATWTEMAARSGRAEKLRQELIADKARERAGVGDPVQV